MGKITLKRTGQAPLKFSGELVSEASSKKFQGPAENRYFDLSIYSAEQGGYVMAVEYHTHWQGEHDQYFAHVCRDAGEVREYLGTFDPCDEVLWAGIPANVHDAQRRNAMYRNAIGTAFREAVSEVLNDEQFMENLDLEDRDDELRESEVRGE